MKKKILAIIIVFVLMIANMTNVFAAEMIDVGLFETAYKLSKENDINLPFINLFEKDAVYDETVKKSGISFAESTLEIKDKMEGIHVILSGDMVTITGEIEHAVIYGKNVVVEGKISEDTIIMAETVQILENAVVEKDIVIVSDELKVIGTVKGNLIGYIDNVNVSGTVESLRISASTVNLENSKISGTIDIDLPYGTDTSKIKEVYPNATLNIASYEEETKTAKDYLKIVINGAKHVLVYTFVAMLITKKEKGITTKMAARFMDNSTFGLLMASLVLFLSPIVAGILVALGIFGLGIIAWPVLIIFVAVILLAIILGQLIFGVFVYELLRKKVTKYKLPVMAGIYAVVFAVTQIPGISTYVISALSMISLGTLITYVFKKAKTSEFIEFTETKNIKIEEVKKDEEKTEEIKEEINEEQPKTDTKKKAKKNKKKK